MKLRQLVIALGIALAFVLVACGDKVTMPILPEIQQLRAERALQPDGRSPDLVISWTTKFCESCQGLGGTPEWQGLRTSDHFWLGGVPKVATTFTLECTSATGNKVTKSVTYTPP